MIISPKNFLFLKFHLRVKRDLTVQTNKTEKHPATFVRGLSPITFIFIQSFANTEFNHSYTKLNLIKSFDQVR